MTRLQAQIAIADMAAAEDALAGLMQGGSAGGGFGIIRVEIEPSHALVQLGVEEFVGLSSRIATTLQDLLRPADRLFTDDGWNWLIVLPDIVSPTVLTLALVKLSRGVHARRDISAHGPLNPVFGGAYYPDSAQDIHGLLAMARLATFDARRSGERFMLGLPVDNQAERHLASLVRRIQPALLGDELDIHLQPQVSCTTGRCDSVEVLLRWHDGDIWISPPTIVTAIERAALRTAFNRWLIQRCFRCMKELDAAGIQLTYSINLAAADIHDPETADLLAQALSTWEVDSSRITLEITETAMVHETDESRENLRRLKQLGLRLSLDDFGTAYSAMSYLRHMPVEELKIDQIFTRDLNGSAIDREIVTSIIRLAHQLKLVVLAEGVETQDVWETLRSLGCDLVQGFYFSRPLPQTEFVEWWKAREAP